MHEFDMQNPNMEYSFTKKEVQEVQQHIAKYPDRASAIMPALWIAQEKFGWLPAEAMKLVADTVDVPYAQVYGVASFYTMYLKKEVPKHLIEVCTCFTCSVTGGPEMYEEAKKLIEADEKGFGKEGKIWVREAECLGACDTAPVCQVTNRRYRHNLTKEKLATLVSQLRADEDISFESVPLKDQSVIED
ncbi:MAG: NAD(P)H-dependent oxidoreductase subunit E [Bacteroidota bacterium]